MWPWDAFSMKIRLYTVLWVSLKSWRWIWSYYMSRNKTASSNKIFHMYNVVWMGDIRKILKDGDQEIFRQNWLLVYRRNEQGSVQMQDNLKEKSRWRRSEPTTMSFRFRKNKLPKLLKTFLLCFHGNHKPSLFKSFQRNTEFFC